MRETFEIIQTGMTAFLVQAGAALLIAFSVDIIDYEEFLITYELNMSREIFLAFFFLINSIFFF